MNRIPAKRWIDAAFRTNANRHLKWILQYIGELMCLLLSKVSRNLTATKWNFTIDARRGVKFMVQDDCQASAHILASDLGKTFRTFFVQGKLDFRLAHVSADRHRAAYSAACQFGGLLYNDLFDLFGAIARTFLVSQQFIPGGTSAFLTNSSLFSWTILNSK